MWVPLATSGSIVTVNNFWNAIFLYHDRPHIINRKLVGVSTVYFYNVDFNSNSNKLVDLINYVSVYYESRKLSSYCKDSLKDLLRNLLEPYDKNVKLAECSIDDAKQSAGGVFVSVRILHASNSFSEDCVEVILLDRRTNTASFVAATDKDKYKLVAPPFQYRFECTKDGHVKFNVHVDDVESSSAEWLADKVFPKFIKWAEEYDDSLINKQSLSLISVDRYCTLYKELKSKYGKSMVEIWPENTDPLKFVFEDVAIAAYLICLWERVNPGKRPSFVDLGCGNGLLVYILNNEGFPGFGVDVRKRKIWDLYPETVKLEIKTIVPSDSSLFPETDWIIGNHSDELTPWIPVIAARSSIKTNFFVLPCCSYDFNGQKYIRKNPNQSQYSEYLEYVESISKTCGFNVLVDKLRIPSTKRTCIISFDRNHPENEFAEIDRNVKQLIDSRCGVSDNTWVKDFQPRESVEKVRNCTKLNKDLIRTIIECILNKLLEATNELDKFDGSRWNSGGVFQFSELIKVVDNTYLKQLKNECGGLQTLLKNHRYIFEVRQGTVKLRVPPLYRDVQKYKEKPCWFLKNHPSGCLNDDSCAYSHG